MDKQRFEFIKALFEFERLTRDDQFELIEEIERLQVENKQLHAKFHRLMEFTLSAGLTPEWIKTDET